MHHITQNPGTLAAAGAQKVAKALKLGNTESITRRPKRKSAWVEFDDGNGITRIRLVGREVWCLERLVTAGRQGCTPIDTPAPRWSHYVWLLRGHGLDIETITEDHGGAYWGTHARYVLHTPVVIEEDAA